MAPTWYARHPKRTKTGKLRFWDVGIFDKTLYSQYSSTDIDWNDDNEEEPFFDGVDTLRWHLIARASWWK